MWGLFNVAGGGKTSLAELMSFITLYDKILANAAFAGRDWNPVAKMSTRYSANCPVIAADNDTNVYTSILPDATKLTFDALSSLCEAGAWSQDGSVAYTVIQESDLAALIMSGSYFTSVNGSVVHAALLGLPVAADADGKKRRAISVQYGDEITACAIISFDPVQRIVEIEAAYAEFTVLVRGFRFHGMPLITIEGCVTVPSRFVLPRSSNGAHSKAADELDILRDHLRNWREKLLEAQEADGITNREADIRQASRMVARLESMVAAQTSDLNRSPIDTRKLNVTDDPVPYYDGDKSQLLIVDCLPLEALFKSTGVFFLDSLGSILYTAGGNALRGGLSSKIPELLYRSTFCHGVLLYAPPTSGADPLADFDFTAFLSGKFEVEDPIYFVGSNLTLPRRVICTSRAVNRRHTEFELMTWDVSSRTVTLQVPATITSDQQPLLFVKDVSDFFAQKLAEEMGI